MTVRDIRHHPATTIGTELSIGTISNITDAVADAMMAWQTRPLEEFYPVIYLDAIRLKVRADHKVGAGPRISRWAWTPTGFTHARGHLGRRRRGRLILGARVRHPSNRGVQDVLIVCCDGLTGLPEAVEATWPDSMVPTCVVHQYRRLDAVRVLR